MEKQILGLESSMVKSVNSHIGGLWSTLHLIDTFVTSDRYIVLGLHSLTKIIHYSNWEISW